MTEPGRYDQEEGEDSNYKQKSFNSIQTPKFILNETLNETQFCSKHKGFSHRETEKWKYVTKK